MAFFSGARGLAKAQACVHSGRLRTFTDNSRSIIFGAIPDIISRECLITSQLQRKMIHSPPELEAAHLPGKESSDLNGDALSIISAPHISLLDAPTNP